MTDATQLSTGLRNFADWLDEHPDYASQVPGGHNFNIFLDTKEELLAFKKASGITRLEKGAVSNWFHLRCDFGGGITLDANIAREEACRRVVTGIREIPETTTTTPASTEEIVEWVCEPLLAEVQS